jgi:hypothetical protein
MVFLGLALLLLAFFALLNAISTIEEQRSRQVVDSVVATFSDPFRFRSTAPAHQPEPEIAFAERYFRSLEKLFRRTLELVHVEFIEAGRGLQINVRAERLFAAGRSAISPRGRALLGRVAESLTRPPPGVRLDLEVFFERAATPSTPTDDPDIARAATIARTLTGNGVAPDDIAIGLVEGRTGEIRMVFRVRPEAEGPRNRLAVADPVAARQ